MTENVINSPVAQNKSWFDRQRDKWSSAFAHRAISADEVELVQNRIYVLPTVRGLGVIAIAIILLLVGVNYQLSLAYVVSFLLGGLLQVALHATYRNLRGLRIRAGQSPRAIVGETLSFSLAISSPERMREGITLTRTSAESSAPHGKLVKLGGRAVRELLKRALRLRLQADQQAVYSIEVKAARRGVIPLGRIQIESRAPYGIIRAWSYVHFEWVGLVEPAPEMPYPELPHALGDDAKTAAKADVAHDPDSLREYVPGDSLKRVAWKQVAKSGEWYTRTGEAGQRGEVDLRWDAISLTDTEARLSRMAAWIDRARNENVAFSLSMPTGALPLADSAPHHMEALAMLATYPKPLTEVAGVRA
jgi:uncharacterized protein (DUF58 family)